MDTAGFNVGDRRVERFKVISLPTEVDAHVADPRPGIQGIQHRAPSGQAAQARFPG